MAVRTLWKLVVGRVKTFITNYNVIEKTERYLEKEKRVSPRHPGTEAKFKVLIKGNPDVQNEIDKKSEELLDRLKSIKISSEDTMSEAHRRKDLPQDREVHKLPPYGFEEPKTVPEGKCTLRHALQFIQDYQNDPARHTVKAIADNYNMKSSDVEQVLHNFKAFELLIPRDNKMKMGNNAYQILGASKITKQLYNSKFSSSEKNVPSVSKD